MPIPGIPQPEFLPVDSTLRLRRYDGCHDFALPWYSDSQTVLLVDGVPQPYTPQKLARMYQVLDGRGELYFIELWEEGRWHPVGDVTFSQSDLPIVLGEPALRGRGIGGRVIAALIRHARELGFPRLCVEEIYSYNAASRRMFERAGFRPLQTTRQGSSYYLDL